MVFFALGVNAQKTDVGKSVKIDMNTKKVSSFLPIGLKSGKTVFLSETFDTEIPSTWSVTTTGTGDMPGWFWADTYEANSIPLTGFACIDSDENGGAETTAGELVSPSFDCSGVTTVLLDFDVRYNDLTEGNDELFKVDVWDGSEWQNVITWDEDHGDADVPEHVSMNIGAYANADCKVRFVYQDDGWDWYAGVDNISVVEPVAHDLGVIAINPLLVVPGNTYTPTTLVKNFGANDENVFSVEMNITNASDGMSVYSNTVDISTYTVTANSTYEVEMGATWTPTVEGTYSVTSTVVLASDLEATNDVMSKEAMSAYMYYMGGDDVVTCSGLFYDTGGIDGDYEANETYSMTFTPATSGMMMQVYFDNYEVEGSDYDYLTIYDGEDTTAAVIDTHYGTSDDNYFKGKTISATNPTGALTFEFVSDGSVQKAGWEATLNCAAPVEFHVTDGTNDLEGATVKIGNQSMETDADGLALFVLQEGDISYSVTANFCETYTGTYTVTTDVDQAVEVELVPFDTYTVTFHTYENYGTNADVQDALITVGHEATGSTWTATTNVDGIAEIVLPESEFEFSVNADGYVYTETATFTVTAAYSITANATIEVPLDENIITPNVSVTDNGVDGALVEWSSTAEEVELRHDDGIATGQLGFQGGTANGVMGSVFNNNMKITKVKWFLTDGSGITSINLFIFGLKADGTPDESNILFQEMGITSTLLEWNTLELPESVLAEEGFYVALSCDGFLALAIDDGAGEPYVAESATHYYSSDYTGGEWTDMYSAFPNNFLLRPVGFDNGEVAKTNPIAKANVSNSNVTSNESLTYIPLEKPIVVDTENDAKNDAKVTQSFDLYFFPEAELENQANWTEVSMGIADDVDTYTDTDNWPVTVDGTYYWAVITHYETGVSEAGISNGLEFLNTYTATFTVTENWGDNLLIDGAMVTVTDNDEISLEGTTTSGVYAFEDILPVGNYDYTVSADGYIEMSGTFSVTTGDVDVDVALDESIVAPYGLVADVTSATDATLTWNNDLGFFDDFESYDDFSLTFDPWTLLDVDASTTYGFQGITFPNSGAAMAGIIFNPSQTDPVLDNPAYSGDKFVAIFNATSLLDDDWVIAPLTQVANGTSVTFQAKAGDATYSAEKFQVFVSTTGLNTTDFTAISDIVTTPGTDWAEYSYDLSAYAGQEVYVAIRCTSEDQFYLCIDDFNIGQAKTKEFQSYNVYLDDMTTPVATGLTDATYDFTGLTPELHTAGVEAVYETGNSEIVTVDIDMTVDINELEANVSISPNPTNGLITISSDQNCSVKVFDIAGRLIVATEMVSNIANVDISAEKAGLYIVRLSNENGTSTYKVIKK